MNDDINRLFEEQKRGLALANELEYHIGVARNCQMSLTILVEENRSLRQQLSRRFPHKRYNMPFIERA